MKQQRVLFFSSCCFI